MNKGENINSELEIKEKKELKFIENKLLFNTKIQLKNIVIFGTLLIVMAFLLKLLEYRFPDLFASLNDFLWSGSTSIHVIPFLCLIIMFPFIIFVYSFKYIVEDRITYKNSVERLRQNSVTDYGASCITDEQIKKYDNIFILIKASMKYKDE